MMMTASTTSTGGDSTIANSNSNTQDVTTNKEEESANVSKTGQEGIKIASNDDGDCVNISKGYIVVAADTAAGSE